MRGTYESFDQQTSRHHSSKCAEIASSGSHSLRAEGCDDRRDESSADLPEVRVKLSKARPPRVPLRIATPLQAHVLPFHPTHQSLNSSPIGPHTALLDLRPPEMIQSSDRRMQQKTGQVDSVP
jgi:hypothetical protein